MAGSIWNYPRAAAQLAARSGFDPGAAYDVLSTLGMSVDRNQWDALYGQAQVAIANVGPASTYDVNQYPTADLLQQVTTVTSTGYGVQVQLTAVDQKTGDESTLYYTARSSDPLTGQDAINSAIEAHVTRGKDYKYDVVDAQVTGYYNYVPQ